ncbi:MAG: membrane protein insertion efficiency factor YidD [Rhodocyclaceae bacterium]|nr:membrane protein insertion efficiency factor YidD [Rhodocyclaceae bacterium]MBX3670996.1 membrane protein insertion efficiency factor YidD [Rhodocyclaceae bacterium]
MKRLALIAIRLYQRLLSPHKGFTCAYRHHTGRAGCSELGYRAIRRFGLLGGLRVLRERLYKCGVAWRRANAAKPRLNRQAGVCDASCDLPCDADMGGCACDLLSSCDLPGDCGKRWTRRRGSGDKWVYLPPDGSARVGQDAPAT